MPDALRITKLTVSQALDLRDKAGAGDPAAVVDYVLYAVWREFRSRKDLDPVERVKAFLKRASHLMINVEIEGSSV